MHLAPPVLPSTLFDSLSPVKPTNVIPSDNVTASEERLDVTSPSRQPPPYRSPPPPSGTPICPSPSLTSIESSEFEMPSQNMKQENELERKQETLVMARSLSRDDLLSTSTKVTEETVIHTPPPVPPRRKSSDRLKLESKENVTDTMTKRLRMIGPEAVNKMVSN